MTEQPDTAAIRAMIANDDMAHWLEMTEDLCDALDECRDERDYWRRCVECPGGDQ